MKYLILFIFTIPILILCLSKRHKKSDPDGLSIGDIITTIGGLTGKIVALADDTVTIETNGTKVLVQCSRWAVNTTTISVQ